MTLFSWPMTAARKETSAKPSWEISGGHDGWRDDTDLVVWCVALGKIGFRLVEGVGDDVFYRSGRVLECIDIFGAMADCILTTCDGKRRR